MTPAGRLDAGPWRQEWQDAWRLLPQVPRQGWPEYFGTVAAVARALPAELREAVVSGATAAEGGYLLITGLPTADAPATPTKRDASPDRPLMPAEAWASLLGSLLGVAVAYTEHRDGSFLHDICPVPGAHPLSAQTSEVELGFHTEMAYHASRPRFVLLACTRPDPAGEALTYVASARRALPLLPPEAQLTLRTSAIASGVDTCFEGMSDPGRVPRFPVLGGHPQDPTLSYDCALLRPAEGRTRQALDALDAALRASADAVALRPGQCLVIDNWRTAHARGPFRAHGDGRDRWLHRLYVAARTSEHADAIHSLPFRPRREFGAEGRGNR